MPDFSDCPRIELKIIGMICPLLEKLQYPKLLEICVSMLLCRAQSFGCHKWHLDAIDKALMPPLVTRSVSTFVSGQKVHCTPFISQINAPPVP